MLGILLLGANIAAQTADWYQMIPLFDKGMHIAGGAFVALACTGIYRQWKPLRAPLNTLQILGIVLLIGLAWEGYEYVVQALTGAQLATIPDSGLDLIADMAGGVIGAIFVRQQKKRYNTL